SFAGMRRVVCLQEVIRPSAAVLAQRSVGTRHPDSAAVPALDPREISRAEPGGGGRILEPGLRKLAGRLAGDLDAIVMKAMRKEPEHRYGSAAEMAEDIDRYLEGFPVTARKGSGLYHTGKFLRRNKPIVAIFALVLILALVSTLLGWQAEKARRVAVEARVESESLKDVLIDILKSPAPDEAQGRERTVREVVDEARPKIAEQLGDRPRLQAQMLDILGEVFNELGDHGKALELHQEALAIERAHDPSPHGLLADYIANVGSAHYTLQQFEAAEERYREALAVREQSGDDDLAIARTLYNLTNVRVHLGHKAGIEEAYRRVLDLRRGRGAPSRAIADSLYSLGVWALLRGDPEGAVPYLEEGLRLRREVHGDRSTGVAAVAKTLARAYHATGRLAESRRLYEESLATQRLLLGEAHGKVIRLELHLVRLLLDLGELEAAEHLARGAHTRASIHLPEGHVDQRIAASVWGACQLRQGVDAGARERVLQGYEALRAKHGEEAFVTRWTRRQLAGSGRRDGLQDSGEEVVDGDAVSRDAVSRDAAGRDRGRSRGPRSGKGPATATKLRR
ncbi:MAG: tetratricopeptide repeat protein, partial [Holophagales bacterium]|nr:tetratricopeptide repeat protein [Holophagales bacterium]